VLIAMGILTMGLLGVAAVFPVGGWYIQKADVADRGSAIAQSVMSDIVTRGMLNPRAWYVMTPNPRSTTSTAWNTGFPSDGKYSPTGTPDKGTFTRPFALALNEALTQATAATDPTLITKQFGSAYVIDPLGLSVLAIRNGGVPTQAVAHGPAAVFPATAHGAFYSYAKIPNWGTSVWSPWSGGSSSTCNGYAWPIRRVTFRQPDTGWQMDGAMAEHYFRGSDDLAYDFPQRDDRPAMQNWDTANINNTPTPLARQWTGDYSWIVTVAPTTNAARDGMARNPEGFAYDVSVVVFYKRVLPDSADDVYPILGTNNSQYLSAMSRNERAVKTSVLSTGLNGGELLLADWIPVDVVDSSNKSVSAFEQLKTGQWIMLCGPHPNSSISEPRFAMNWYQVMSIEGSEERLNSVGTTSPAPPANDPERRLVTVRGPQWPWQPSPDPTNAANDLCVAICRGAVAVHSKTLRLESPVGSTVQSFGSAGNPKTDQPPYTFP